VRYKINRSISIRTENAAKPASQKSQFLKALMGRLQPVTASLDFGCGKLRYVDAILETTDTLVVVDSNVQLSREQMLGGKRTSIRQLLRRSNRVKALNTVEFVDSEERFDRAFCINVLSVIPSAATRKKVVQFILSKLKPEGSCLFVVQYRNSDFTRMKEMKNAREMKGGFLIDSLRGFSFYSLIPPARLIKFLQSSGFHIEDLTLNEGSAYVLATRSRASRLKKKFKVREEPFFSIQ
jgi:SAM-dependent methyltransferase